MQYRIREQKELKPSGVEWLGNIPNDWKVIQIKRFINTIIGGSWGNNKQNNSNDMICLRVADMNYQSLNFNLNKITIRNIEPNEANSRILKKNDIVIEKSGGGEKTSVGRAVLFDLDKKAVCSNFMNKISINTKFVDSKFMVYIFSSLYSKKIVLGSIKQTTGIQNLNVENYLLNPFSFPIFKEQQKIANFLDEKSKTFDDTISKKEELITKLQDAKQSLISEVVTGKLKVIQKDGKLQTIKREKEELINSNIDWLGDIPRDWQILQIKHYGKYQSGDFIPAERIDKKGNFPVFGGNGLRGYTKDYNLEGKYVLIGRQGALCGNINYTENKSWVTEHAIVVYNKKNIDVDWLGLVLEIMNLNQYSIASAQPGLSIDNITKVRSISPQLEEQKQISKYLDEKIQTFDNTIEKTKQSIEKLKQAKESLISEAVTGKIEIL